MEKSFFTSTSIEGGPLGGNVNTITEIVEAQVLSSALSQPQCDRDALVDRL